MNREIDLKGYLPPYLLNYKELNALLTVQTTWVQLLETSHWQMVNNRYFNTADENGIARFENMLGITPLDDDTLEGRRFRVQSRWNKELPYNYKYLINQLEALCNEDYDIILNTDELTLEVRIGVPAANMFADVKAMIDSVIPCNIVWELKQLYNTYATLGNFTHSQLSKYTHNQLRNEVIS